MNTRNTAGDTEADLDLSTAGWATVEYVYFINAPWDALWLGGGASSISPSAASTVSYSTFGGGFSSHGYSETAEQTATLYTGVFMFNDYTGAYYNSINFAGTAAINMFTGSTQLVYGNSINSNRYEQPGGVSGGQVYVNYQTTYATVGNNTINGDYWYTNMAQDRNPANPHYVRCLPGTGFWPFGIEGFGTGSRYYNNQIEQNIGFGMLLRAWGAGYTLDSAIISGYDPFCTSGCTPQYVTNNGGCWSLSGKCYYTGSGSGWPASMVIAGISVNNALGGNITNLTLARPRPIDSQ